MKRKHYDERDCVVTEVMGEEREQTKQRMCRVFGTLVNMKDNGRPFPIWGESMAKLMQLAYVLSKWQVLRDADGRPLNTAQSARRLCRALHCRVPGNIYQPVSRCRRLHKRSIVDYYAMLWRENKTGPEISLLWSVPIQFPRLKSYRGVF